VRYLAFKIEAVFPAGHVLAEWLVTLALAMNDLIVVHVRLDEDQDSPELAFYWNRLAVSHFTEAMLFLERTTGLDEVAGFVDSLPDPARQAREESFEVFNERRGRLFSVRNKATFHYPELRPGGGQAVRPVGDALRELAGERGVIRSARLRDARALFADDVVATLFAGELGGFDAVAELRARVASGVTAFIRFANLALDEYLMRMRASGAQVEEVERVDADDLRRGWRVLRQL
jgi:hypothetical protein